MKKLIFMALVFNSVNLKAQTGIPVLNSYASDFTGSLSSTELHELNHLLEDFKESDSVHVVFLYVNSLQECSIDDYLSLVVSENKIGNENYFDGVILFCSKDENTKIIFPSFRFENIFRPALVSSIIRNRVNHYFDRGRYYEGIKSGLEAIFSNLQGKYRTVKTADYDPKYDNESHRGLIELIIFSLFIIPWFLKKSRGLGTLFSLRTLSGRKRFLPGLVSFYGFDGELRYFYGPFYGLFRRGGPIKSGAHLFKGKIISGKW